VFEAETAEWAGAVVVVFPSSIVKNYSSPSVKATAWFFPGSGTFVWLKPSSDPVRGGNRCFRNCNISEHLMYDRMHWMCRKPPSHAARFFIHEL